MNKHIIIIIIIFFLYALLRYRLYIHGYQHYRYNDYSHHIDIDSKGYQTVFDNVINKLHEFISV